MKRIGADAGMGGEGGFDDGVLGIEAGEADRSERNAEAGQRQMCRSASSPR